MTIQIYTDGGSNPKTNQAAGWAFAVAPFSEGGQWLVYFGYLPPPSTNNIAEMTGVLNAMKLMLDFSKKTGRKVPPVHIFSDSQYVVKGLNEWRVKWEYEGYPEKNRDIWIQLFRTWDELKMNCMDLRVIWVRGHAGNQGNQIADDWTHHAKRDSGFAVNNHVLKTTKVVGEFLPTLQTRPTEN